jgi:predicted ATPase
LAVSLTRHFEEAGMTVKAVEYLLQAGERAARLFANDEAIAHFKHGIELVETLGDTPQRDQFELALLLALSVPLKATHGFSGDELAKTFGRAQELIRESKASHELFQTLSGFKTYYMLRGDFSKAIEISEELLRVSGELKDPGLIALAHHQMGATLLYLGKPNGFLDHRKQMAALYDHERDQSLVYQMGLDAQLTSLCHAGWAHWYLGYPDKAKQRSEEAVNRAKALGHPFILSLALMFAAYSSMYRRDVASARELAEETIAFASEQGHPLWLAGGLATLGWALVEEGELDEGIAHIQRGLKGGRAMGAWLGYTLDIRQLIETYRKAGKVAEGLAVVDEALALIGKMGGWLEEPEVHRLQGELLLLDVGMDGEAEACFQRAIEVAKKQKAKSWELRATMSLCRLWQGQGKREGAREMLAEIYNWFTEGFDTPDLQEAKSLLEALS